MKESQILKDEMQEKKYQSKMKKSKIIFDFVYLFWIILS